MCTPDLPNQSKIRLCCFVSLLFGHKNTEVKFPDLHMKQAMITLQEMAVFNSLNDS